MVDFEINKRLSFLIKEVFKVSPFAFSQKYNDNGGVKTSQIIRGRNGLSTQMLGKIIQAYPEINQNWLLTGEGEMLKAGSVTPEVAEAEEVPVVNYERRGVPYYDVDFLGGFDLVFNDHTIRPKYYVQFPGYEAADCWVNVTGHSMEPKISHGDVVAIKELQNWNANILYGELYALVTDENRTIKYVRKSKEGKDWLRLVPANTTEFDEQDIHKETILRVFKVLGAAKRFQ